MAYKKHLLKYPSNGIEFTTTPKNWARENQHFFPKFGFTNNSSDIPITNAITDFLVNTYNFDLEKTERLKIWRNSNVQF